MTENKYEPWLTYKDFDSSVLDIPITEPPCKGCQYFHPRVVVDSRGVFDSVRLCHTPKEQWPDFSCYRPKEDTEKDGTA